MSLSEGRSWNSRTMSKGFGELALRGEAALEGWGGPEDSSCCTPSSDLIRRPSVFTWSSVAVRLITACNRFARVGFDCDAIATWADRAGVTYIEGMLTSGVEA